MAEYIEKEALLASLAIEDYPWTEFDDAFKIVQDEPPADVAPVKHGKWLAGELDFCNCSECGNEIPEHAISPYCDECGAKMDGED